jgi:methionyl-tRNA synthetase
VHAIGKEILWFHAVIWPALLMALGLETPKCVYAHSFWVRDGKKMSKQLGNFIDLALLKAYIDWIPDSVRKQAEKDQQEPRPLGVDVLRWYLLTQGPLRETDADFSHAKYVEVYNADLANGIGNCASRVANMIEKYFDGKVPDSKGVTAAQNVPTDKITDWAQTALWAVNDGGPSDALDDFEIDAPLQRGIQLTRQVDEYISITRPFSLAKEITSPEDPKRQTLAAILYQCAETTRIASLFLYPAMPEKMAALWRTWNCSPLVNPSDANSAFKAPLGELAVFGGEYGLKAGHQIAKGDALFMRAKAEDPAPVAGQ